MSTKERNHKVILDCVKEGQYTLMEASKKLGVSTGKQTDPGPLQTANIMTPF